MFIDLFTTYKIIYYTILILAAFGFLSLIFCIVKFFWLILNFSNKKDKATDIDSYQNRRIKQLESEVKVLRNIEKEFEDIKKKVNSNSNS